MKIFVEIIKTIIAGILVMATTITGVSYLATDSNAVLKALSSNNVYQNAVDVAVEEVASYYDATSEELAKAITDEVTSVVKDRLSSNTYPAILDQTIYRVVKNKLGNYNPEDALLSNAVAEEIQLTVEEFVAPVLNKYHPYLFIAFIVSASLLGLYLVIIIVTTAISMKKIKALKQENTDLKARLAAGEVVTTSAEVKRPVEVTIEEVEVKETPKKNTTKKNASK